MAHDRLRSGLDPAISHAINGFDGLEACIYDRYQLASQMILDQEMDWGAIAVCVGLTRLHRFEYTRAELQPMIDDIEQGGAEFQVPLEEHVFGGDIHLLDVCHEDDVGRRDIAAGVTAVEENVQSGRTKELEQFGRDK